MSQHEEEEALVDLWGYAFGYINFKVVQSAVELEIPDILENHGGPMSLSELSSAVDCPTETLYRIMRFLIHHGIFKKAQPPVPVGDSVGENGIFLSSVYYAATPLSRRMTKGHFSSFMLIQGPTPGIHGITPEGFKNGAVRPDHFDGENEKMLTEAMECQARAAMAAVIDNYPEGFKGIVSLVDVGDHRRRGMALAILAKAFPLVQGITFDLPETVAKGPTLDDDVPKAEAVLLMWILHELSDDVCIVILRKCKDAVPTQTGKVIIVEAIVDEEGKGDEFTGARLSLDMAMMAVTANGKERTHSEWTYLLSAAGFSRHKVTNIKSVVSVVEAFP